MTAMKDILEHPRVARSTVNSGGVEHRVTTMVVGSEALARFEERAGHGWRRVDERFVKGTRRPMHVRTELRRADFPRRSQLDRYHTCKAPASVMACTDSMRQALPHSSMSFMAWSFALEAA